jgi:hypothetical protein
MADQSPTRRKGDSMKRLHDRTTGSDRLRRLGWVLGALVLSGGPIGVSSLAYPSVAGAATTVTITPNADIFSGQSVTVQGSTTVVGNVVVIECAAGAVSAPGSPYDPNQCDTANTTTAPVDSSGNYSAALTFEDPLPTASGSVDCSVDGSCIIVVDNPNPGDVIVDSPVTGSTCNGIFSGADSGRSFKSTDAGPYGAMVVPSQTINVQLTWTPSDWKPLNKTVDCVEMNGTHSGPLSEKHKPIGNTGSDTFSYVIPVTATVGSQFCDRGGVVGGRPSATQKTNTLCYTVGPGAVTPEFSSAIALPVVAGAIGVGSLVFTGHRRRRRALVR